MSKVTGSKSLDHVLPGAHRGSPLHFFPRGSGWGVVEESMPHSPGGIELGGHVEVGAGTA